MINQLKAIAKRLLAIVWVRRAYEGTLRVLLETLAANRVTSLVYSVLSIPTFNREQFAVLRGRRDYYRNLSKARHSRTELRRNVHRLEKGILMRPRRAVFALDYLVETVEFYERAVAQVAAGALGDEGEMAWAHNVLANYFDIVDRANPVVADAAARFEATHARYRPAAADKVPYARARGARSAASYDDLLALAQQRRSVRWFEQRPVPRELVDKALLVGRQSPSACNRLPYEFRIFDDPEMVKTVAAIPFGSAGYAHQIPTLAVVVGRLNHYFSPRDRHIIYVDSALACMPFMLALETLGLASSVINWPDFEPLERRMQARLDLDMDERVIMLIAIGYPDPDGLVAYSEKKSLDVIRRYNDLGRRTH
jgi:nitroreductase